MSSAYRMRGDIDPDRPGAHHSHGAVLLRCPIARSGSAPLFRVFGPL
ncbi:hypothetical protein ACFYPK_22860 [Streptomyces halstedii]|nr:hypothetical protein [Streptomyces sp. NTK 937]WSX34572.1 hypothetical protein OG291_02340 [Streptomyces halstedii]